MPRLSVGKVAKFVLFNDSDNATHGIYATKSENIQSIYIVDGTTIDIYIRNPIGGFSVAASTETNAFADTGETVTDDTINIDGTAITITANTLGADVAAIVANTTFTNYTAIVTNTNRVTFTQKTKGGSGNVAITMSDAQYTKAGGTHTIIAANFTSGYYDEYGNASDDKIRITTDAAKSYDVFIEILNKISTFDVIDDGMTYVSNIDYIAGSSPSGEY
tara:strand:- start:100 stop:756 length:657 start_codon:yes stop_codon:yes gene_type:complete